MITRTGTFEGRALLNRFSVGKSEQATPGAIPNKQFGMVLEVTGGPFAGEQVPWRMTIRQNDPVERQEDIDRLIEVLRTCGWQGVKLGELLHGKLDGFGDVDVRLVFENEYFDVTNKRTVRESEIDPQTLEVCLQNGDIEARVRLRYINRRVEATMKNPLEDSELDSFVDEVDAYVEMAGASAGRRRIEKQQQQRGGTYDPKSGGRPAAAAAKNGTARA